MRRRKAQMISCTQSALPPEHTAFLPRDMRPCRSPTTDDRRDSSLSRRRRIRTQAASFSSAEAAMVKEYFSRNERVFQPIMRAVVTAIQSIPPALCGVYPPICSKHSRRNNWQPDRLRGSALRSYRSRNCIRPRRKSSLPHPRLGPAESGHQKLSNRGQRKRRHRGCR